MYKKVLAVLWAIGVASATYYEEPKQYEYSPALSAQKTYESPVTSYSSDFTSYLPPVVTSYTTTHGVSSASYAKNDVGPVITTYSEPTISTTVAPVTLAPVAYSAKTYVAPVVTKSAPAYSYQSVTSHVTHHPVETVSRAYLPAAEEPVTYKPPVVSKTYVAPVVAKTYTAPTSTYTAPQTSYAHSYQSFSSTPVKKVEASPVLSYVAPSVSTYTAPAVSTYTAPVAKTAYSYQSISSTPVKEVVAVPAVRYAAPVESTYSVPVTTYSRPVTTYSYAPVSSYSTPAVSTYTVPAVTLKTGLPAYSYQSVSKTDVRPALIYDPAATKYAVPLVSTYSAPSASSYRVPAVSSYTSPAVSTYTAENSYSAPTVSTYTVPTVIKTGQPAYFYQSISKTDVKPTFEYAPAVSTGNTLYAPTISYSVAPTVSKSYIRPLYSYSAVPSSYASPEFSTYPSYGLHTGSQSLTSLESVPGISAYATNSYGIRSGFPSYGSSPTYSTIRLAHPSEWTFT